MKLREFGEGQADWRLWLWWVTGNQFLWILHKRKASLKMFPNHWWPTVQGATWFGEHWCVWKDDYPVTRWSRLLPDVHSRHDRYTWMYALKWKDQVSISSWSERLQLKSLQVESWKSCTQTMVVSTRQWSSETSSSQKELTVPKMPEQNGMAERKNQIVIETVKSMLPDAKLPHRFWEEELSTAV